MLIIMMLLSSPVFLTIPEGSWLSSDYIMTEEWTLDPFEFVFTERVHIGCITESESSEYDWDITLIDGSGVIRFEDDQQVDRIDIDLTVFPQIRLSFSPGGNYLLIFDFQLANCLRIDLEEMQVESMNILDYHVPGYTSHKIANSGSIIISSSSYGGTPTRRIFDASLELVFEDHGYRKYNEWLSCDHEGNRYFFTKLNQLIALNANGQEIWRTEIGLSGDIYGDDFVQYFTTNPFGNSVVVLRVFLLQLFSGDTGAAFYSESFDYVVANPLFSSSGQFLAVETNAYEEMSNYTNGIRLYSINSLTNEVTVKYHSINLNREGTRFYAVSVLDNGMVLARLSNKLILLDSSGNAVWISDPLISGSRGFATSCGRNGGMTRDGRGIWYFDGSLLRAYHIEKI